MSLSTLLLPLFGAIALGAALRALKLFDGEDARRFSRFAFMVAMPFAGFNFMRTSPIAGDIFLGVAAGYVISLVVVTLAAFTIARTVLGLTVRQAGAAVFTTTCGNAIFLGIPIAAAVEGWAAPVLILVLLEGTFVFAIGTALMTWPEGEAGGDVRSVAGNFMGALFRAVKSPIVLGVLLGLAAALTEWPIGEALDHFFGFFGRTAGPLGLFILGVSATDLMLGRQVKDLRGAAFLLPLKLIMFPALTGGLVWIFTRDPSATSAATLFTGLPPAVASIVLSRVYNQWVGGVSGVVTIGSVLGLVLLALYLLLVIPS